MRTRKPAASSSPSCHRCTAVLFAGIARCGMCGWPAGVGYPPADGELDQVTAEAPTEPEAPEPDHVAAQLDALSGMVARQGQPLAPTDAEPVSTSDASVTPDAAPSAKIEESAPVAVAEPAAPQPASVPVEAEAADEEIDPLTAPLSALTGAKVDATTSVMDDVPAVTAPPAPEAENVQNDNHDTGEPFESIDQGVPAATGTAGRSTALVRPAELLIVAAAVLNAVLFGFDAAFAPTSGTMTTVVLGLSLITLVVWTGAAVTFLHWISRAHTHVAATAATPQRHGPSMALFGWFIPIAGFVIGYRVLQDLWTGSDPATRDQKDAPPAKVRILDVWLLGIITASLFGYLMPLALDDSALWSGISALGLMAAALSLAGAIATIGGWQVDAGSSPDADDAVASVDEVDESAPIPAPEPEPVSVSAQ